VVGILKLMFMFLFLPCVNVHFVAGIFYFCELLSFFHLRGAYSGILVCARLFADVYFSWQFLTFGN